MTPREHLAALLGPDALVELDACVASAPPLTDAMRAELAAGFAAALAESRRSVGGAG